jgi:hypothetical protein
MGKARFTPSSFGKGDVEDRGYTAAVFMLSVTPHHRAALPVVAGGVHQFHCTKVSGYTI